MTNRSWNDRLLEQIDGHWTHALRPRLEGLTDEEYLWEPVPSWNVRPGEGGAVAIEFEYPEPDPTPFTTIAWRLAHVIVGVLAVRNASHFGAPATSYQDWDYAATAKEALAQLDEQYAAWVEGVRSLGDEGLENPCGPAEGPYADWPMADLVLHIHRELIHHGAEIATLRDLYQHSDGRTF